MLYIAWDPIYTHPLPTKHRFPMEKYELLPQQLLWEGLIYPEQLISPTDEVALKDILRVHDHGYVKKLDQGLLSKAEIRRSGFPYSKELIKREKIIAQGTIDCCHYALKHGISMNIAGGTHHAHPDRADGFCLLNDQAIAAAYLYYNQLAKKITIIDLDVHQGDGTAKIFEKDPNVLTISLHGEKNYPLKKEKSNIDIGLPDNTTDKEYLNQLEIVFNETIIPFQPDFIFYQCGVDILKEDKLGRLAMTIEGTKKRDEIVIGYAYKNQIPLVACMGGGYAPDIKLIVQAHANTFRVALDFYD